MRQVPEETSGCAREGTRQKPDEPGEAEEDGQEEMRVTTAGKNRIAIYDPKTVLFGALLILSGCTREEATASLRGDLQVDEFEISMLDFHADHLTCISLATDFELA
jgi:hypothetical protein